MRNRIFLAAFILCSAAAGARALVPPLDQKKLHNAYKESEFESVSRELEDYSRKYQGKSWLREDSIFLYKHLAVIYTANQETREKGKYYMISMLRIMPSAEILDMYVSEEVDRIFLRTRQEFMANMTMFGIDTASIKVPTAPPGGKGPGQGFAGHAAAASGTTGAVSSGGSGSPGESPLAKSPANKSGWGWKATAWTAGGVALVAAGVSAYFLMQMDEPTEKVNTIPVPAKTGN